MVPVIMYHRLAPDPSNVYERTPQEFRAELERLAREGYVPVTAADYVTGNIDIPAGKHPVVLTFDDSTIDQVALTAAGKPKPGTAVKILQEVAAQHPDFRAVATFFVNQDPFTLGSRGLQWLREHGFEIGNHTYTHANLSELAASGVRRQVAKLHKELTSALPDADVTTMALPLGARPDKVELAAHGTWKGITYDYSGVFLVGARPANSPFSRDFDPLGIPRIRSQGLEGKGAEHCSTHWLNFLEKHPEKRYTADGNPEEISFPKGRGGQLSDGLQKRANPY